MSIPHLSNILLLTDSYKVSHAKQYPPGTTSVYSYFESRGGQYPELVFFGLQYLLKNFLVGQVVTQEKIDYAHEFFKAHFPADIFNRDGWEYILHHHNGRLPIRIKAVPEGTPVTVSNVVMTVENTDPKCFWLTNYLETLLVQVWYPATVATHSRAQKKIIKRYLDETGVPGPENLPLGFKLHDFGFRGVSSVETAGLGAAAHLVNFVGTDTLAGLIVAREVYKEPCAGYSIPAAEHSTITSWGREHEVDAFRNMLDTYSTGPVACVSDSYNIYAACRDLWGTVLKDKILGRDGCVVIRPDSGDPPEVCLKILEILGEKFGYQQNAKGYKVLDPHVRIIQGDGIDAEMLERVLGHLKEAGWSADNIAFGSGGGLLQKLNRDTQKCAFKCSYVRVGEHDVEVFKDPITDPGKKSKKGRLSLHNINGQWLTKQGTEADEATDAMVEVFLNGELRHEWTFAEVRKNAEL